MAELAQEGKSNPVVQTILRSIGRSCNLHKGLFTYYVIKDLEGSNLSRVIDNHNRALDPTPLKGKPIGYTPPELYLQYHACNTVEELTFGPV